MFAKDISQNETIGNIIKLYDMDEIRQYVIHSILLSILLGPWKASRKHAFIILHPLLKSYFI